MIASVILAQSGSGLDGCDAERLQAKSIATAGNDDEGGGNDEGDGDDDDSKDDGNEDDDGDDDGGDGDMTTMETTETMARKAMRLR